MLNERPPRIYVSFRKHQTLGTIESIDKCWQIYKIPNELSFSICYINWYIPTSSNFLYSLRPTRNVNKKKNKEKDVLFEILHFFLWNSHHCCHWQFLWIKKCFIVVLIGKESKFWPLSVGYFSGKEELGIAYFSKSHQLIVVILPLIIYFPFSPGQNIRTLSSQV